MSPLQSPPPSLPAHSPSLPSPTSFTTTTNNTSSSSSSSSTTITPSTLHSHIKYFPSPIARPSSNMSTSTNSSSTSALNSTSTSVSDSSSVVSAPSFSSVPLHLSAHTRDLSAPAPTIRASSPQGGTLRVSQSQSHIRSSSAGVDNALISGNSYNNIINSFSTASSPVLSPFVSPQLDSSEGGTNSPVRDTRPTQSHQSFQQPFSPRLLSFLRSQSQEHERNSSAGSAVSSSSNSTKANSITSSSTGSYSSVEIISHSNDATVNNISSFNVSSANNSGFGYARQVVFGGEEQSSAAFHGINTTTPPSSSPPAICTFHSNTSSVSTNMLMNSYGNNANDSSTYVPPSNNMNQTDNPNNPNAYSKNNANNLDPTFSMSTNDYSSYQQYANTPHNQPSYQNYNSNFHSSSPVSSSPLSSQYSISGQPSSLSSNNSVDSQISGSAMANPQQQEKQQLSLNANYRDSYSSSKSSPSPLTSSTATLQPQNQLKIQPQQQFAVTPTDMQVAANNTAIIDPSTDVPQNVQGLTPNVYINGLPPHFPDESLYLMTREFGTVKSVRTFTRHVGDRLSGYGFVLFETIGAAEKCISSLRRYRNLHPSFSKQLHKIPGTPFGSALSASLSINSNMSSAGSLNSIASSQSYASSVASSGTSFSTATSADENASNGIGGDDGGRLGDADRESFRIKMERLMDMNSTNLYIEGLPLSIDEHTLAALVAPNMIKSSRLFQTKLSDPPRIIAFVRFETRKAAEEIIERLHGRVVRGWNDNGSRISVRFADSNEQRELRRAERIARGEDEDPASKNRLTMAQAALLNIRGAQVQAQLQNQAKLNISKSTGFTGADPIDKFGQLSTPNHRAQLPLHPLTISPPMTAFTGTPGIVTPTTFGMYQQNEMKPSPRYVEPFTSATNAQTQAQAQEYARLLESMSLTGMNTGGAGLDLDFDTNAAAVAAATLRNARSSSVFKVHEFNPPATAVPILPTDNTAMSPALVAHAQALAMLQQQRDQELIRLQQHQQSRGLRPIGSGAAINMDSMNSNVNMRSILDPANNAFETARLLQQQQMKYQRRQQASFGVDMMNSMASPMTDGNYMSSPEFSDPRGQQAVGGSMANNSQRHSAPSNFSSFLHQAAERHARNHSVSVGQQQHQISSSEHGTPFVSPALTYASRTPATLSPATPFFNAFNTPAIHQNQKAPINIGGGGVGVVGVDGATGTNRGLKNDFQN